LPARDFPGNNLLEFARGCYRPASAPVRRQSLAISGELDGLASSALSLLRWLPACPRGHPSVPVVTSYPAPLIREAGQSGSTDDRVVPVTPRARNLPLLHRVKRQTTGAKIKCVCPLWHWRTLSDILVGYQRYLIFAPKQMKTRQDGESAAGATPISIAPGLFLPSRSVPLPTDRQRRVREQQQRGACHQRNRREIPHRVMRKPGKQGGAMVKLARPRAACSHRAPTWRRVRYLWYRRRRGDCRRELLLQAYAQLLRKTCVPGHRVPPPRRGDDHPPRICWIVGLALAHAKIRGTRHDGSGKENFKISHRYSSMVFLQPVGLRGPTAAIADSRRLMPLSSDAGRRRRCSIFSIIHNGVHQGARAFAAEHGSDQRKHFRPLPGIHAVFCVPRTALCDGATCGRRAAPARRCMFAGNARSSAFVGRETPIRRRTSSTFRIRHAFLVLRTMPKKRLTRLGRPRGICVKRVRTE